MIHVWMKGKDYNIYEISSFYGFRLFQLLYKLYSNDDFSSFTESRLARLHHAWWRIDGELCQGIETKLKRIVIWTMFGHEAIHINLSFTKSRKSKDVEIVEAEI